MHRKRATWVAAVAIGVGFSRAGRRYRHHLRSQDRLRAGPRAVNARAQAGRGGPGGQGGPGGFGGTGGPSGGPNHHGGPGGPQRGPPPPGREGRGIEQGRYDHQPFNYDNQWVQPIFDLDFNNGGFWFFGIWIPL